MIVHAPAPRSMTTHTSGLQSNKFDHHILSRFAHWWCKCIVLGSTVYYCALLCLLHMSLAFFFLPNSRNMCCSTLQKLSLRTATIVSLIELLMLSLLLVSIASVWERKRLSSQIERERKNSQNQITTPTQPHTHSHHPLPTYSRNTESTALLLTTIYILVRDVYSYGDFVLLWCDPSCRCELWSSFNGSESR